MRFFKFMILSLQPSSVLLGLQFTVVEAVCTTIYAFCQRKDCGVVDALVAYRPQLVCVKEPQGALKGEFSRHEIGVRHYVRPTNIVGERLEIKFASELEAASASEKPPVARRFVAVTHAVGVDAVGDALGLAFQVVGTTHW